jgi:hypothetical protein
MKKPGFFTAWAFGLALVQSAVSAPEYIAHFASFPAYPYNTSAYKLGGAFVGCGPTTGAMMFGYFQAAYSLTDLLTSPGTGVDKGLNTAWALHGAAYMNTGADGFGNVLNIKPGLVNYAAAKGYTVKVLIHVSPTYTSPNATFDAYGPFGDAWTNDASFFQQKADGSWKIDPASFCDFLEPNLDAGIPIFLTIDSDGNGGGDHWVALVGFDRATGKYAFYNTYSTTLQWADIYYVIDSSGHKVNSISYVRTVALSIPDIASSPAAGTFGTVTMGSWVERAFTISNLGNADLSVTGVTLSGVNAADFSIQSGGGSFTLAAAAARDIVVRFTPSGAGSRTAALNIAGNDPDENPFTISLNGTGTAGSVPDIACDPDSWNYGNVEIGSHSEKTFTVSNEGTSGLSVTSVVISGTDASQFSIESGGGAFTLAAAGTRGIVVRFAPSSEGVKSASLDVSSNDPDEGTLSIDMTGSTPSAAAAPPPRNLTALNGFDGAVPLAWKAPTGVSAEDPVRGYHIYRSVPFTKSQFLGTTSNTYFRDASAVNKTDYTYTVKAVYHDGESAASNTAQGEAISRGYTVQSTFTTSPPAIDGVVGTIEWYHAGAANIIPPGVTGMVSFIVMNDANYLYVAVNDERDASLDKNDTFGLFFDSDHNGEWPSSLPSMEGLLQLFWNGTESACSYLGAKGTWPFGITGGSWTKPPGVTAAVSAASGHVQYEGRISLPICLQAVPGDTLGILVYLFEGNTETFHGVWPQETPLKLAAYTTGYGWAYGPFAYGDIRLARQTAVDGALAAVPDAFRLGQNYPNPFNPVTTISYSLPASSDIRLAVYDVAGRLVSVLAEGRQPAGEYRVCFDAEGLNSGIYFCRLAAGSRIVTQKMTLLK